MSGRSGSGGIGRMRVVLAGALAVTVVACLGVGVLVWRSEGSDPLVGSLLIRNDRADRITVSASTGGEVEVLGGDARTLPIDDDCASVRHVAVDTRGDELGRVDGVCATSTWIFGRAGDVRLVPGRAD